MTSNKTFSLRDLIAETYTADERKWVVLCDAGNGCAYGEAGRVVEYDPAEHGDLMMTPTLDHISDDGVACAYASEWQVGANGYRWQVRF